MTRGKAFTPLARLAPNSIGIVDPQRNALVGEIRFTTRPAAVAVGDGVTNRLERDSAERSAGTNTAPSRERQERGYAARRRGPAGSSTGSANWRRARATRWRERRLSDSGCPAMMISSAWKVRSASAMA